MPIYQSFFNIKADDTDMTIRYLPGILGGTPGYGEVHIFNFTARGDLGGEPGQWNRETEETKDKEQTNFQGSTAQILPPVIPISILEPDVLKTLPKTTPISESDIPKSLPKPNIPYPSRRDDQSPWTKLRIKW
ncbi:hypothetical protein Tco_1110240 [Tanacetum coccineum]|uniref:Uncharacterized protein n=1 Tax=Tanacetum coccineum TaxID=301880 RepID=A0ABQ5II82_9ASTR